MIQLSLNFFYARGSVYPLALPKFSNWFLLEPVLTLHTAKVVGFLSGELPLFISWAPLS